ncbi:MAG: hypothetical protein ACI8TP_003579 [Acidimicrobiales bacterium]|jgi:hypothetical protein
MVGSLLLTPWLTRPGSRLSTRSSSIPPRCATTPGLCHSAVDSATSWSTGGASDSLLEARVLIEDHRIDYNSTDQTPPTAQGDLTPTEFAANWRHNHQPQVAWQLAHPPGSSQGSRRLRQGGLPDRRTSHTRSGERWHPALYEVRASNDVRLDDDPIEVVARSALFDREGLGKRWPSIGSDTLSRRSRLDLLD